MVKGGRWMFNGHTDFSNSGKTDNPRIGTTEDWAFYSFTAIHPIHIHLINFQVIGQATLKKHSSECYFAEMDYWIQINVITCCATSNVAGCVNCSNFTALCEKIDTIDTTDPIIKQKMSNAFPEDAEPTNNIVGFNIYSQINAAETNPDSNCQTSQYRYICSYPNADNIPKWYQGWKEVGIIPSGQIIVFRIRWTSTDYPFNGAADSPYFRLPEDELIEYPGYVYHCHFLNHEDSGLMRSFQMLPSDQFDANYGVSGTDLGDCMKRCGFQNSDGWNARYQCINNITGCKTLTC